MALRQKANTIIIHPSSDEMIVEIIHWCRSRWGRAHMNWSYLDGLDRGKRILFIDIWEDTIDLTEFKLTWL